MTTNDKRNTGVGQSDRADGGGDLSIMEAAQVMGVHANTIRRVIHAGTLRAYQIGRQWRIPRAALAEVRGEGMPESVGSDVGSDLPAPRPARQAGE